LERLSFFDVAVVILAHDGVDDRIPWLIATWITTIFNLTKKLKDASFLVFCELNSVQSVAGSHNQTRTSWGAG
jgi:hypothetical protein